MCSICFIDEIDNYDFKKIGDNLIAIVNKNIEILVISNIKYDKK